MAAIENILWGNLKGLESINLKVQHFHSKRKNSWKKNIMVVPTSKAGKDFIAEAVRLLRLFNLNTIWSSVAINLVIIFFPLMLQKPSARSKPRDHTKYLQ